MLNSLISLFVLLNLSYIHTAHADAPYIAIGAAHIKKSVVAFPPIENSNTVLNGAAKAIQQTISNDLDFMDAFKILDPKAYSTLQGSSDGTGDQKLSAWKSFGADYLVKTALSWDPNGKTLIFTGQVYDVNRVNPVLSNRYLAPQKDLKTLAHTFANDIVKALTGQPGIFLTQLAMSCEVGGKKEIYLMNYDGSDVRQLTRHRSIAFGAAWSPDASKLAYSLITRHANRVKNIDLFELDFATNRLRPLSTRKGINSGPAYSPDGKTMAVTLSFGGNPVIYSLNLENLNVKKLTQSLGFDVDPAWHPNGQSLAFVSSRSGVPMVYKMRADGTQVQRLTYAGQYNATPSWSPFTKKIAFAGWLDKHFDIFTMNEDGTHIERLSKNQGNNEDPFFSPDGNFIAFSSNRTGSKNIFVMNTDGTVVKRLTYGLGNCVAPKWSPIVPGSSGNVEVRSAS